MAQLGLTASHLNPVIKQFFITTAVVGVACFLCIFLWLNPKVQTLLDKSIYLVERGLLEEAESYRTEASSLNDWIIPIATVGFLLLVLSSFFFSWTYKNANRS